MECISRRAFTVAGVATTLVAGKALAAEPSDEWNEEFDVIVVGAGIAGMTAAIAAAQADSGASVLLAEKCEQPSGNSPYCYGDSIYTNDADAFFVYLQQMCDGVTPDDVLKAFAEHVRDDKDWLVSIGANEEEMDIQEPGTADNPAVCDDCEYPEFECSWSDGLFSVGHSKLVDVKGPNHIHVFLDETLGNYPNITYRTLAPMEDLVQDESGRVLGAVIDGKRVKANRGVILCCGGFESDPVMLEDYAGKGGAIPAAGKGNTGDGIRAAIRAGADLWHMACVGSWLAPRDLANTMFTNHVLRTRNYKRYGITVAKNGRRFYMDWDGHKAFTNRDPEADVSVQVGWRHGHTQFGGEWFTIPMPNEGWFVFDQAGLEAGAIDPEMSSDPAADGFCYTADTIEELAAQMGVPAEELSETVKVWNSYCEQGKDLSFYRPADTLTPIAEPPFYAQLCVSAFLNTDGGPRRDAKARVLDTHGDSIPGLYSAGELGSVWGKLYQGSGNVAECLAFGRIAAQSAINQE